MSGVYERAVDALRHGGVIAYPTEAVWGLGCDPHNESAVARLFALKQRPAGAGVLLIGADFSQVSKYIGALPAAELERIQASWLANETLVFPRNGAVPAWISGEHAGIALRVTAHPIAAALCRAFGGALVSTSANRHAEQPARTSDEVRGMFGDELDVIIEGALGGLERPTPIRDALTGKLLRH